MASPAVRLQTQDTTGFGSPFVCAHDSPLVETQRACARVAVSDSTVLLTGETGTGKEIAARYLHAVSARARGPFVPVNCGAIPDGLLETELFGHTRGAFTDAIVTRKGRVAMAQGGTLFLDEIGEMPLPLQVKLLRLLQERAYEPVGSSESVPADFRLIVATHRDLADEVKRGRFRGDLYYRLHVCPMRLPALRERTMDVPVLFRHFWARRGETRPIDTAVMDRLHRYSWPGNVRELENLVERLSVCSEGSTITVADLPFDMGDVQSPGSIAQTGAAGPPDVIGFPFRVAESSDMLPGVESAAPAADGAPAPLPAGALSSAAVPDAVIAGVALPIDLPGMLRSLENAYIDAALAETRNNKKEAAKLLGMGRTTLVEKLRRRAVGASDPADAVDPPGNPRS